MLTYGVITENQEAVEHYEALLKMQLHDVLYITMPTKIMITRVIGGWLYSLGTTNIPTFIPLNLKDNFKTMLI